MISKTIKVVLYFILLFTCSPMSLAQNILSLAANMLQPGDSIVKEEVEYVYSGNSGKNVIWDFSNLTVENSYYLKYDTLNKSQFVGYDAHKTYKYHLSNDSLKLLGYESPLIGVEYQRPQLIMPFPLQLNQVYISDFQGDGLYCGTRYERTFGTIKIEAEAEGTLILSEKDTLPNTLRIYTVNTEAILLNRDSSQNASGNIKQIITEHYQWFARGYRYPVFETITSSTYDNLNHVSTQQHAYRCKPEVQQILQDSINERIRINDKLITSNGDNDRQSDDNDALDSGNPGFSYQLATNNNHVNIIYNLEHPAHIHAMLVDVMGTVHRELQQTNNPGVGYTMNIDCSSLRRGQYIIYINVNGTIFNTKIPVK